VPTEYETAIPSDVSGRMSWNTLHCDRTGPLCKHAVVRLVDQRKVRITRHFQVADVIKGIQASLSCQTKSLLNPVKLVLTAHNATGKYSNYHGASATTSVDTADRTVLINLTDSKNYVDREATVK